MEIAVYKKGVTRPCNTATYHLNNREYKDYSCPFCNLVLHSDFNLNTSQTNRRCNCGGTVSIDNEKTQAEKQESYSQSSEKDTNQNSTQQEAI